MKKVAKSSSDYFQFERQEGNDKIGITTYSSGSNGKASNVVKGQVINIDPKEFYEMFIFLFPEYAKDIAPDDFDERVRQAVVRLKESDEDIAERIRNYEDGNEIT